jgi:Transposase, Mutator family
VTVDATSAILPPWARRLAKVTQVLRSLYLRGLSTKDFEPAPAEFFCSEAGLRASTIQRLTREWSAQLAGFRQRDLSQVDYVYTVAARAWWYGPLSRPSMRGRGTTSTPHATSASRDQSRRGAAPVDYRLQHTHT